MRGEEKGEETTQAKQSPEVPADDEDAPEAQSDGERDAWILVVDQALVALRQSSVKRAVKRRECRRDQRGA